MIYIQKNIENRSSWHVNWQHDPADACIATLVL